jgi:hypothetical protein
MGISWEEGVKLIRNLAYLETLCIAKLCPEAEKAEKLAVAYLLKDGVKFLFCTERQKSWYTSTS